MQLFYDYIVTVIYYICIKIIAYNMYNYDILCTVYSSYMNTQGVVNANCAFVINSLMSWKTLKGSF